MAGRGSLMSDLPRYKLFWFFKNVMDADGDGVINEEDFVRIALKHAVFFCKGGYFKDIYENHIATFKRIWQGLAQAADINKDGVITFQEWNAYISQLRPSVRSFADLPEHLREFIEYHFYSYDHNRDGHIDINKYRLELCGKCMDLKQATSAYESMMTEANGAKGDIDKKRFFELVFDYLFSTDPHSPGSHICGPIMSTKKSALDWYAKMAGVH